MTEFIHPISLAFFQLTIRSLYNENILSDMTENFEFIKAVSDTYQA